MKIQRSFLAALFLSIINLQPSTCFAQGNLNPPGPPTNIFKTLDQIEPRTPISSLPFTITKPGSYYVVSNLTSAADNVGISIQTNNVTIDLNGFALTGRTNSTMRGIDIPNATRTNLVVRNGTVNNWGNGGVNFGPQSRIENVYASSNLLNNGLVVGESSIVRGCGAIANGFNGIAAGQGSLVENCVAARNKQVGIFVGPG